MQFNYVAFYICYQSEGYSTQKKMEDVKGYRCNIHSLGDEKSCYGINKNYFYAMANSEIQRVLHLTLI